MEMSDMRSETSSQKEMIMSQEHGNNYSLIVSLIVGLLVVVNIIITAILLGRPVTTNNNAMTQDTAAGGPVINMGSSSAGVSTGSQPGSRVYLLAYGHDFGGYEYIDSGGYHRGFFRDLMNEVCTAAGVQCKAVFDKYNNCWESPPGQHPSLGTGLQARYYDGWIGWQPTVERIHTASFSMPFTSPNKAYFYYKKGTTFSTSDFTGKKIGFIDGWADNEKCLARTVKGNKGIPLKNDQIVYVLDPKTLFDMIESGEVDAGFASVVSLGDFANDDKVDHLESQPLICVMGGLSVMSRADSEFPEIWNTGFQKILTNGQYKTLCEKAKEDHSEKGEIECISSYDWDV